MSTFNSALIFLRFYRVKIVLLFLESQFNDFVQKPSLLMKINISIIKIVCCITVSIFFGVSQLLHKFELKDYLISPLKGDNDYDTLATDISTIVAF